jgi:hypothetical protein
VILSKKLFPLLLLLLLSLDPKELLSLLDLLLLLESSPLKKLPHPLFFLLPLVLLLIPLNKLLPLLLLLAPIYIAHIKDLEARDALPLFFTVKW